MKLHPAFTTRHPTLRPSIFILSVCAALTGFSSVVQNLEDGGDLAGAVATARSNWETTGAGQEIVLGAGTYELASRQIVQFPLVVRGATGNPTEILIDGKGATQLFQLDHADAVIQSVTLTGGSVFPESDQYAPYYGGAVLICLYDGREGWREPTTGAGGTVSNCVITSCSARVKGYNTGACGAAVACLSSNGLVTHCRIVGNSSERWDGYSRASGMIVSMTLGTMRNCVVANNSQGSDGQGSIVRVGSGAKIVNCDILLNSAKGASAAPIDAVSGSVVVNTAIAGNSTTSVEAHYATWRGDSASFVNCAADGDAAINGTCVLASLDAMKFAYAQGVDIRPLAGSPLLGAGTTDAAYDYGTTDLYGKPRFRNATIDIGAAQFDASAVPHQPVYYVKVGNTGAAEPYDTVATASADIQTAIDFCGAGEKVVILEGTYEIEEDVKVDKAIEVVGATGNPEDVVLHNTVAGYRCLTVSSAGARVSSLTLENGSPDWSHMRTSSGTGAYLSAGTVSNLVVRNCQMNGTKNERGAAVQAEGADAHVTHCVITNNVSKGGAQDGFYVGGVGLHLDNGATAVNCLVADNRNVHSASGNWYGWGQAAAFVGDGSLMSFCTIAGNTSILLGGVAVDGTGAFKACIVAGNTTVDSTLTNAARHAVWSAFPSSTSLKLATIQSDSSQNTEASVAADAAARLIYNATDVSTHGLGGTTVLTTTGGLIRDLGNKDWGLPNRSPAAYAVPKSSGIRFPSSDVLGNRRSRTICDIGCFVSLAKKETVIMLR